MQKQPDLEWLQTVVEDDGRGAVERFTKFEEAESMTSHASLFRRGHAIQLPKVDDADSDYSANVIYTSIICALQFISKDLM